MQELETEYHRAVKTGLRLARDRLEPLDAILTQKMSEFSNGGLAASDSYYRNVQGACLSTFKEAARMLIDHLIAQKADRASNRRDELVTALADLKTDFLELFDRYDWTPQHSKPVAERADLQRVLDAALERVMLDFDDGVFHMTGNEKRDGGIRIGSIGQMAGHIGSGNQGTIRADQTLNEGSVLKELAQAINAEVMDAADRERLLAAVEAMNQARNDKGRLGMAYASFISTAADYMSLISPFLPALGQLIHAGV